MNNIFLIGARGAGKSTIGASLAERLGRPFYDTDRMICQRAGKSVAEIVEDAGWPGFRRLEAEVLADCLAFSASVIATGGGAVLHRQLWRRRDPGSLVVWLKVEVDTLVSRLRGDSSGSRGRPSLTGQSAADEVAEVVSRRLPLYRELAHIIIDADALDISTIVTDIVRMTAEKRKGETERGR